MRCLHCRSSPTTVPSNKAVSYTHLDVYKRQFLLSSPDAAFGLLLIATGALGFGFGATLMALNTYTESFFPARSDRAVLALNALLGTGTALAPLLIALFLGLGVWWGLPILVACTLALILISALRQPLQFHFPGDGSSSAAGSFRGLPSRFWLYAAVVFLYGVCLLYTSCFGRLRQPRRC